MRQDKNIKKTGRKFGSHADRQPVHNWTEEQACARQEKEYLEHFMRMGEKPVRSSNAAYIHPEFHERIQRIVQVIGKNRISFSVYVNHVLEQHFIENEGVIRRLYKKNYEDVY